MGIHAARGAAERAQFAWGIMLFPAVAAAAFLLLLPAVRRGRAYAADNGTPWRSLWYPWALFGVLAAGVGLRAYSLSMSFYWVPGGQTPFAAWFLVPLLFAGAVLLLEAGLVSRRMGLQVAALFVPAAAVLFAILGRETPFYHLLVREAASPVLLTSFLAAGFYAYAWLRGALGGELWLVGALLLCSMVQPSAPATDALGAPQLWLLATIALFELVLAVMRPTSARVFVAGAGQLLLLTLALRGSWVLGPRGVAPTWGALGWLLFVAAVYRDAFARFLQRLGAVLLAMLFVMAVGGWFGAGAGTRAGHALVLAAVTLAYAWRWGGLWYGVAFASQVFVALTGAAYALLTMRDLPRGAGPVFWGALAFLIALLISLAKGGLLRRGADWLCHARWRDGVSF